MQDALLQGALFGLVLSMLWGPVTFVLIETSHSKGFKKAVVMELGVISSDILWIILLYAGLATFIQPALESKYTHLVGALIFIGIGTAMLLSNSKKKKENAASIRKNRNLFFRGFLLNFALPSVPLFWIGGISMATVTCNGDQALILSYFITAIVVLLLADFIKLYTAARLLNLLHDKWRNVPGMVAGCVLMVVGVGLVVRFIQH